MAAWVEVAAAIVRDPEGRVLLSQRPAHKHQGGCWEFPGGKLEAGEPVHRALARELDEELGLRVTQCRPFMTIEHQYPELSVRLFFREVTAFAGEPLGCEGQPVAWFRSHELSQLDFPAANRPVVTALGLPDSWAILPDDMDEDTFVRALPGQVEAQRGIYLRGLEASPERLARFAAHCRQAGLPFMVRDDASLAASQGARVLHLSATMARRLDSPPAFDGLLSLACHDRRELEQALDWRADMLLLSPVAATPSHPDVSPLGWQGLEALATGLPVAVYALGGMSPGDLLRAREAGARGVAGIRSFWHGAG